MPTSAFFSLKSPLKTANADRVVADDERGIFIVADASGPSYGGEYEPVAVSAGLEAILSVLHRQDTATPSLLREAFATANNIMLPLNRAAEDEGRRFSESKGVHGRLAHGTCSATVLWFDGGSAVVGQIGSGRVYRWRNGTVRLLLLDHTLESQLRAREDDSGLSSGVAQNVLTRALGFPEVEPDIGTSDLQRGDRFLLCTDGLWTILSNDNDWPRPILERSVSPESATSRLRARIAGQHRDDVSALTVYV